MNWWRLLDTFVHVLGKFVPGPVVAWVCDRYDRSLGVMDD